MSAPGWPDFDADVVAKLRRGDPAAINKARGGGMRCPLAGHDEWLRWHSDDYTRGTRPHGEPSLSFRVSPTYILDDPLENFIAGRELVAGALGGEWKKAETFRLGYENSEDAVSWNVFRSLQEAGQLSRAALVLAGVERDSEPELMLWGRRIDLDTTAPTPEIQQALDTLEPTHAQQTEPDVVLRVPDWGWIFIEAKLSSPTSTYAGKPAKLKAWRQRYADPMPGLFDATALESADPKTFPEQLLRNVAVANSVRKDGEQAIVVALVRHRYAKAVSEWGVDYMGPDAPVATHSVTWEQLYAALPPDDERVSSVRNYLETKSVGLLRAFHLKQPVDEASAR